MYQHILIATDGSEAAGKGVKAGLDLAKATGAKVTFVTVSEAFPAFDLGTHLGLFRDQDAIDRYDAHCREMGETILTGTQEAAAEAGVVCEVLHVENSRPADAILETATSLGCDLIVLTSQGKRGLERFMLGSQATRVVQAAETSVLVVR